MARVFLGLGSNLGNRLRFLQDAVGAIARLKDTKVFRISSVYETDPVGKTDQPRFLNAVVELESGLSPETLHGMLKQLERQLGRTESIRWGPREIDIDVLLYDSLRLKTEHLVIPHPELSRRRFVLVPLVELDPDARDPVSRQTAGKLLARCPAGGEVKKTRLTIEQMAQEK